MLRLLRAVLPPPIETPLHMGGVMVLKCMTHICRPRKHLWPTYIHEKNQHINQSTHKDKHFRRTPVPKHQNTVVFHRTHPDLLRPFPTLRPTGTNDPPPPAVRQDGLGGAGEEHRHRPRHSQTRLMELVRDWWTGELKWHWGGAMRGLSGLKRHWGGEGWFSGSSFWGGSMAVPQF